MFNITHALKQIKRDLLPCLSPKVIQAACREAGYSFRQRVLDPLATIHVFVLQVLHGNTAITHLRHLSGMDFTASAYCQARMRLPLAVLQKLLRGVCQALQDTLEEGHWLGHRVFHVDGSAFSMPDTPELQKKFGQRKGQKPGCGFPVAHLLALFHAGTGVLLKVLAAPLHTHDMSQAAMLHPELQAGDVLVGDRAFCSYAHLALLVQQGLHGVFRLHQRTIVDFTPGRPYSEPGKKRIKGVPTSRWWCSLGHKDQWVQWHKPKQRPRWMRAEQYAQLPASLLLRELRYWVSPPGFRTEEVTLVTTLLSSHEYSSQALASLYRVRWQVELNLRHLKQTMKMDVLHCTTEQGILKELTVFALVYNLVRVVMTVAAERQDVPVERISFVDALRWLAAAKPGSKLPKLVVNPDRPNRIEPRAVKRRPKQYARLNRPRKQLHKRLPHNKVAA